MQHLNRACAGQTVSRCPHSPVLPPKLQFFGIIEIIIIYRIQHNPFELISMFFLLLSFMTHREWHSHIPSPDNLKKLGGRGRQAALFHQRGE
jgi:hypothetical protein